MPHLRHLALRCRDLARSRKFYETAIGWKFVGFRESGDSLDQSDGVNNITLLSHPADPPRQQLEEGNEFIHFGVIVDDLEACWRRCREFGAEISKGDVKDRTAVDPNHPPVRSFKVLDPDGNVIDITADREEWRGVSL
jgi:catechol 2,3-dioxygenase-like lactoylglutathione lyase family enzyme